jgi:hypothetical protein
VQGLEAVQCGSHIQLDRLHAGGIAQSSRPVGGLGVKWRVG